MNEFQTAYLKEIRLSDVSMARIADLIVQFQRIRSMVIEDIFVCDAIDDAGNRNFSNLWIISEDFYSESKQFLTKSHIDYMSRKTMGTLIDLSYVDTDFVDYKDSSIIRVTANTGQGTMSLFASGNNCPHLLRIVQKYWIHPDFLCNPTA